MKEYNLIVVGSGSAASKPAHSANDAGWDVTVVDSKPIGGTCALRGCMPKKVFVGAAETIESSRRLEEHGIECEDMEIDWSKVQDFKSSYTESYNEGSRNSYENASIDIIEGRAKFVDEETVEVAGNKYRADHFVLATGMKPRPLDFPGAEHLATSTDFLELEEIPDTIVFVGGGYIGFEFAHVAARAGADVTILQRDERPLKMFAEETVDTLIEASEDAGIEVKLNSEADKIEKEGDGFVVHCTNSDYKCTADLVVHSAGRVPAIDDLQLEKAGVERERHGVSVNEHLQSESNPRVWAAGDCASTQGPPLTPVASREGEVVAHNLLEDDNIKPNYEAIPSVLFSIPPLAGVGMLEEQAEEQGLSFEVNEGDMSDWFSSSHIGVEHAHFKTIVAESGELLGAHLIGPHAGEVINVFTAAIRFGISVEELKEMPWSYPTVTADIHYML